MNIIFLDIDGVLCTQRIGFDPGDDLTFIYRLNPLDIYSMKLLNELCSTFDARIVISSSWRKIHSENDIFEHFKNHGFLGKFHSDWSTPNLGGFRGKEINEWLLKNNFSNDDNYICIDDDSSDYFPWQNVCSVDSYEGFGFKDFLFCSNILKRFKDCEMNNEVLISLFEWQIEKINRNIEKLRL